MQIRGIFQEVQMSLSSLVSSFDQVTKLFSALQRIIGLRSSMRREDDSPEEAPELTGASYIRIKEVVLKKENGNILWDVPNITVRQGERKLLMAPSGSGKTALLRLMTGLSEREHYPKLLLPKNIMFVPQRPYIPAGTLRQCLSYPSAEFETEEVLSVMHACHLHHLKKNIDQLKDYQHMLSLGEQQRVNFARVLLHKPQWLVMDEPTSHLNRYCIESICQVLVKMLPATGMLLMTHTQLPYFE